MASKLTPMRFTTKIIRSGSTTYLIIPFDPNEAWGVKQRHHVTGTVNACPVRGSLRSDGSQVFLSLGPVWLRDTGVEVGEDVEVELAPEGPQADALAADVLAALDAEPQAKDFFESLATFYRTGYLRWLESAKRPDTRRARLAEMISLLKAGKKQH